MVKKNKRTGGTHTDIRIGDINDVSGSINIAGGNITTHQTTGGLNAAQIEQLFNQLYTDIDAHHSKISAANKEDIKSEVQEIQTMVTDVVKTNKEVDDSFFTRRFRNIARIAPDILDVIVATLTNPLAGVGIAVRKIAERAQEDIRPT